MARRLRSARNLSARVLPSRRPEASSRRLACTLSPRLAAFFLAIICNSPVRDSRLPSRIPTRSRSSFAIRCFSCRARSALVPLPKAACAARVPRVRGTHQPWSRAFEQDELGLGPGTSDRKVTSHPVLVQVKDELAQWSEQRLPFFCLVSRGVHFPQPWSAVSSNPRPATAQQDRPRQSKRR